ncbi:hypothetical protein EJ03DRAFT_164878 [Teratosphaeria nubilosa]|uniref:Methyltransferase domain-containing protein n=1 Tax=Teratosphaeria nubilosa TaxID=161662 RepID=A0A6G1L279_9PEZI|nr:hypothetical protein EJ03DRAFT_164878 [Teratosphaeria nubilosa]
MTMTWKDDTFSIFRPEQAAAYASERGDSYEEPNHRTVLDYHTGARDSVLDVGTRPGRGIWDLLRYLSTAVGCDTSPQMIEQATRNAVAYNMQTRTSFSMAGAEGRAKAIEEAGMSATKVDLMSVASTSVRPAQILPTGRPCAEAGGAHWRCSRARHFTYILRRGYQDLPLPWTVGAESTFEEASFPRREWDRDGVRLSLPLADGSLGPFLFTKHASIEEMVAGFGFV